MAAELADEQWIQEQRELAKQRQVFQWAKRARQMQHTDTLQDTDRTLAGG
jgi:hypothetical protein